MTGVTLIKKPFAPDDIPATLRRIADQVEAGKFDLRTTCLIVLGNSAQRMDENGDKVDDVEYDLFACGPRCDTFTTRGLLLTVATRF